MPAEPGTHVDISHTPSPHGLGNRIGRGLWGLVWISLFRPSPRPLHRWRVALLKLFGGKVAWTARVYPRARIWAPWNLTLADCATIADDVDCYCVQRVTIGAHSVVSQYCYLCGATHDFESPTRPLLALPITIGRDAWLAADVYVAPGVSISEGVVVGARSSVFEDLPPWTICHGTPAKPARERVLRANVPGEEDEAASP